MELDEYKKLVVGRLEHDFEFLTAYEGTYYDLVAVKSVEEQKILGDNSISNTVIAVSGLDEKCDEAFVRNEIECIPTVLLSGFRDIKRSKTTEFIRIFVMRDIPFDLIQTVRGYSFSKTERRIFDYVVHGGIIIVDSDNGMLYSNQAALKYCALFRYIRPVETKEEEELV